MMQLADEVMNNSAGNKQLQELDNEPTLGEFCRILDELYLPQALSKNIQLTISADKPSEYLHFQKTKLIQITGNLISNSIKFTHSNGHVTFTITIQKKDGTPESIRLEVNDDGVGLSEDGIKNILQDHNITTQGTSGEKGFGFGLSFVKYLIEQNHGNLEIHSTPGKGSRFTVNLSLVS